MAPLISNYNDDMRQLLDAIDKLRHFQVMNEGIQLPTSVAVGDQSSHLQSSVLESLAGISLPRGQGICTRVPLIMRLQNHTSPEPKLQLEFCGKVVEAISSATEEIAGNGFPDLTMVDLLGITRVPVHGQPEDTYEQINNTVMDYIVPKESIIFNVLSAGVDFPTCESIRMSQKVDKTGERTLAVVTKVDKSPEGLQEKVLANDVNIGLGYVCVRNRMGDETYHEVPVLAQKLVQIQATSIAKFLPDTVKKISEKLNKNAAELDNMPRHLSSIADAITAFMRILGSAKESLRKMHCTARMAEMLDGFSADLCNKDKFLEDEMKVSGERKSIRLPNFLHRTAFQTILQRRINVLAERPTYFVGKAWNYVEDIFFEIVEMENMTDYSCSPDYITTWTRLMLQQEQFKAVMNDESKEKRLPFKTLDEVEFGHLQDTQIVEQAFDIKMRIMAYWKIVMRRLVDSLALHQVFTIQNLINKDMEHEIVKEVMSGLTGGAGVGGIERMLEEPPSVVTKRDKLNRSINLLWESKDVVAQILDRISATGQTNV
ncbi:hypothetical protein MKW92_027058 [Papaver armeniacum]|nr:hypothetical protein MKW92_027058 [Papaver armeniacum]